MSDPHELRTQIQGLLHDLAIARERVRKSSLATAQASLAYELAYQGVADIARKNETRISMITLLADAAVPRNIQEQKAIAAAEHMADQSILKILSVQADLLRSAVVLLSVEAKMTSAGG